jgi:tetratricopeptide (TPR) repeat protein
LLRAQRRAIHRPIADWYATRDPALRAEHLERAEDATAPAAYLAAAKTRATALQQEEALALARRGGAIATEPRELCALALMEGELLHDLGQGREALAAYRRALEHAAETMVYAAARCPASPQPTARERRRRSAGGTDERSRRHTAVTTTCPANPPPARQSQFSLGRARRAALPMNRRSPLHAGLATRC